MPDAHRVESLRLIESLHGVLEDMKQANKLEHIKQSFAAVILAGALLILIIASLAGCSPPASSGQIIVMAVTNDAQHDLYCQEGADLIKPYMRLSDGSEKSTDSKKAKADIARGIALLNAVVTYNTNNWAAWWTMGKAYQALDEQDKAWNALGKSYAIHSENPDVAREYMFACVGTGRNKEAIPVAEHAVSLSPGDAGLYANLALVYTLNGRLSDAQSAIKKSLQMDSNDEITINLNKIIQEIADGKRAQPHTIRDMENP